MIHAFVAHLAVGPWPEALMPEELTTVRMPALVSAPRGPRAVVGGAEDTS